MSMKRTKYRGFTIVELLIVIVIIGILAAITIVAYNGVQQRAQASAATSAASQAAKKLAVYEVDNSGYPAALSGAGVANSSGATFQYTQTGGGSGYCLTATNGKVSYTVTQSTQSVAGACPGHGLNGATAITNLAINPNAESGLTNIASYNANVTAASDWANGTASFKIVPTNASQDTFITIGGDLGGFRTGLQAGKTYTISTDIHMSGPFTGSFGASNGCRQIEAWYTIGASTHTKVDGSQAPNSAGTTRQSVTYSIPSTATAAWIRLYHGGASGSGTIWFDNVMITEGSTQYNYADGNTANWIWNGTTNQSSSTGSPV